MRDYEITTWIYPHITSCVNCRTDDQSYYNMKSNGFYTGKRIKSRGLNIDINYKRYNVLDSILYRYDPRCYVFHAINWDELEYLMAWLQYNKSIYKREYCVIKRKFRAIKGVLRMTREKTTNMIEEALLENVWQNA